MFDFLGGLILGLCIGGPVGVLIMAVMAAGKIEDIRRRYDRDPYRR